MAWNLGAGLEGKGVIVTGAAGGIGRAVTQAFATTGAKVMAVDLHQDAAESVVESLEGTGHVAAGLDLTDLDAQKQIIQRAQDELGGLFVLAHLAAVLQRRDSMDEVTEEDWDFQIDTNLKASFFLMREAANAMRAAGEGGKIVAFSSQGWWTGGFGGSVVYCASKGGIVSMVRGLARTYGGRPDHGECGRSRPGRHTHVDDRPRARDARGHDQGDAVGPRGRPIGTRRGCRVLSQPARFLHQRSHHQRQRRLLDVLAGRTERGLTDISPVELEAAPRPMAEPRTHGPTR